MQAKFLSPLIALPMVLAAPALAQMAPAAKGEPAKAEGVSLSATLNGANEVDAQGAPNKGDTDGTGSFAAKLNPGQGKLCYTLTWTGVDEPTMAHIHSGAAGHNGPVVIGLPDIAPGEHCIDIDKERATPLVSKTGNFYVNVHNGDFPNGAIRGQLVKN